MSITIIGVKLSDEELELLEKIKHQKIVLKEGRTKLAFEKTVESYFEEVQTKQERNSKIAEAVKDGYSQIVIANYLGVSCSLVCKVLRE